MTATEVVVSFGVAVAIVIGIVGTLIPILPGLLLIWAAMVVYGIVLGFGWVGAVAMLAATGLVALGLYLNLKIPQRSAATAGLSTKGQLSAAALAVVGLFAFPPFGAPIGFALGIFLLRLHATHDRSGAWTSTVATLGALLKASAAQLACGVGMFALWLVWAVTIVV